MSNNPGYIPDEDAPKLTAYQGRGEEVPRVMEGATGDVNINVGGRRDSVIYNNYPVGKSAFHGPDDLVWMRPRADAEKVPEQGDDICDDGVERDPMDEMERDYEDDERMEKYSCCAETRYNCGRFRDVIEEEAYLLKRSLRKLDVKKQAKKVFSIEKVKGIFPILEWAPKYRMAEFQGDLIAGITVGLTLIPQAIAYAKIANVPAQYGLYSSIIGCFIYVVFGTSKDVALGPTAIQSLLTANYGKGVITQAILLGFFTGIVQLGMYIIGFGYLMALIPFPVMKAFTVACSITIGMTQLKVWLGEVGVPREFLPQLAWTFRKIPEARLYDFLVGFICIIFIVLFRKLKERPWKRKLRDLPWYLKIVKKGLWFIGTGRNIIVLVFSSIVAYIFMLNGMKPFTLTGYIPKGIPGFKAPGFSHFDPKTNVTKGLDEMVGQLGVGIIIVPVLGLIESMSIVNVFARKFNYKADPNQELLPYAIANILGSFIEGYPVCASFSRTAVNGGSGVKTPAGAIYSGAIVLIALQFLTPLFYYIPSAALAVVIIMAVLDPITFHKVWIFWKTKKIDLIPWLVTFICSFVLSIEWGVLIGSGLSILILLYPVVRPKITIHEPEDEIDREKMKVIIVTISTGLMYPAVGYIKEKVLTYCSKVNTGAKYVVFDFSHVSVVDTTTVQGVRELLEDFNKKGIKVFLCGMQKPVATVFRKASPRFFNQAATVSDAVDIATRVDDIPEKNGNVLKNVAEGPKPAVLHYLWEVTHQHDNAKSQNIDDAVRQLEAANPSSRRTSKVSNHGDFNRL